MRRIVPLVLLVVVLAAVLFLIKRREDRQGRRERAEARLVAFDDRGVTALILTVEGVDWRFERQSRGWVLVEPVSDAASTVAIEDLMGAMRRTPVESVIEEPEELSAYGLEPPVASIRIEGVAVPRLDIGEVTPVGDGLFARTEGRAGVLVLGDLAGLGGYLIRPDPGWLRDERLLDILRTEVSALDLSFPAGEISLRRESDGWWIVHPRRVPAADGQVDRILVALEEARVTRFHDDLDRSDPATGLDSPEVSIVVRAPSAVRRLEMGAIDEAGLRFASRDDRETVLSLEGEELAAMPTDLDALESKRLTRLNRYGVTAFVYRQGAVTVEASRDGDRWTSGEKVTIPEDEVYAFLVRVLDLPVSGWEGAPTRAGSVIGELDYTTEDGGEGRIEFLSGRRARVSGLPDVAARLGQDPPPVPRLPTSD